MTRALLSVLSTGKRTHQTAVGRVMMCRSANIGG